MGILTIGIVTIPFLFEGRDKILQAIDGVDAIKENVDALMIINNERLRSIYADLTFVNAFTKADDTLSIAARSIVEIITIEGTMNLDFADVSTTLRNGGVAIISTGLGEGDARVENAIKDALHSPLLNNTDIVNAQRVLINLSFSEESNFMMDEVNAIHEFMQNLNSNVKVIWGYAIDNSLGNSVKITLLASGFDVKNFTGDEVDALVDQDRIEKEQTETTRIEDIYGRGSVTTKGHVKKHHIYLFTPETLDDDNIIFNLEESPTYTRDKAALKRIAAQQPEKAEQATPSAASAQQGGTISF